MLRGETKAYREVCDDACGVSIVTVILYSLPKCQYCGSGPKSGAGVQVDAALELVLRGVKIGRAHV